MPATPTPVPTPTPFSLYAEWSDGYTEARSDFGTWYNSWIAYGNRPTVWLGDCWSGENQARLFDTCDDGLYWDADGTLPFRDTYVPKNTDITLYYKVSGEGGAIYIDIDDGMGGLVPENIVTIEWLDPSIYPVTIHTYPYGCEMYVRVSATDWIGRLANGEIEDFVLRLY